jgi:diadenosine tetraphosphate (Ap4A) HIT family hydrolase
VTCPFCHPQPREIFLENELVLGIWNAYPVSEGHALLITRRHVVDWFEATPEEQQALTAAITPTRQAILENYLPAGFNVGINSGAAAGQTVFHVHLHVVPRYSGTFEPNGELAGLVPHGPKPDRHTAHLFTGYAELIEAVGRAQRVELACQSTAALEFALADLVQRGGTVRRLDAQFNACRLTDANGRESAFLGMGGLGYRLIADQDTRGLRELRERFS